jgi:hypothetical protein
MFVVPPAVSEAYEGVLNEMIADSAFETWVWRVSDAEMPKLPPKAPEQARQGPL